MALQTKYWSLTWLENQLHRCFEASTQTGDEHLRIGGLEPLDHRRRGFVHQTAENVHTNGIELEFFHQIQPQAAPRSLFID